MAITLALPIAIAPNGQLAQLEQDSPADIARAVTILISTTLGDREALPDYGIADQLGAPNLDESEIAQAISTWEDRIDSVQIDQIAQTLADGTALDAATVTLQMLGGS